MNANVMGWFETNEAKISTQQELKYYAEIPKALWLVKNFKMSSRNDNSKIFSNQDESWADQERRWLGATDQTDRVVLNFLGQTQVQKQLINVKS